MEALVYELEFLKRGDNKYDTIENEIRFMARGIVNKMSLDELKKLFDIEVIDPDFIREQNKNHILRLDDSRISNYKRLSLQDNRIRLIFKNHYNAFTRS